MVSATPVSDPFPPQELLDALLDISLTGVVLYTPVYDPAGEVVDFAFAQLNPAAQRMLRLPAQVDRTYLQQFSEAVRTGSFAFLRDTFVSGQVGKFEINYQADGYDNYFRIAAQRVGAGLLVSFTDTADHPRTPVEEALRASQAAEEVTRAEAEAQRQRLYDVLMHLPASVSVHHGPDLVYTLVNAIHQDLFPGRSLLGLPLSEALPELVGQPHLALLTNVYRTGEPFYGTELETWVDFTNTGRLERRYYNACARALPSASGGIDSVLQFSYDVTEQVVARQALAEANAELTAANEQLTCTNASLDTFIYTASHDLRTPISNIEGLLNLLRRKLPAVAPQTDQALPVLDLMQGAVNRFQLTIDQLTDITRLQQSQAQPTEAVDLAGLLNDICLDLAPQFTAADARISLDLGCCPSIRFAPKHLRSILFNLLSNAVKYRHPDRPPVVELRAHCTATTVVLEVQDNGLGLSEAQQSKLFGLFCRLHDHVEGSGIGLYMIKKIVENAGGTITLQSQLGTGSTFTVALPRAEPEGAVAT